MVESEFQILLDTCRFGYLDSFFLSKFDIFISRLVCTFHLVAFPFQCWLRFEVDLRLSEDVLNSFFQWNSMNKK